MTQQWKPIPAALYDLILTGDMEALLWQLKGVREAEEVRMALYNARQAILAAEPSKYAGDHDGMEDDPRTRWQQPATPPASAQDDAKDERQAFEAWAEDEGFPLDCDFFEMSGQYYDHPDTQLAYNIWSTALASVAAPAAGDARAWQGLTDAERDGYVGELVDYGTDFVAPLYSVVESIDKRLREKNGTQQGDAA